MKHLSIFALTLGLGLALTMLWLLSGGLPIAQATMVTVTNTNDSGAGSLRQAIADAASGDTIDFGLTYPATITLTSGELAINKDLTIDGPGAGSLSISGNKAYRVFSIAAGTAVTITGATIRDGNATSGGGIYSQGTLVLSNTDIVSNTATWSGGGVYVNGGSAALSEVQILNNTAYDGGGVYVSPGRATLSSGQIISNTATHSGGGVYVDQSTAAFTQTGVSTIALNTAEYGGGVYVHAGSATLSGGLIISNTGRWGGGVCVLLGSATATVSGGQISSNIAEYGGGAYVNNGSVTVSGGQISHNTGDSGGGVSVFQGSATLSGGQILSNTARYGGGVYVYGGRVILSGGQITNNTADFRGGGVYLGQSTAAFTQTGVSTISLNSAYNGGGVYVSSGSATLSSGQILSNTATSDGGGVYVNGGSATVSNVQLLHNTASSTGGALYKCASSALITVTSSCLVGNSATSVYNNSSSLPSLSATGNWWGAANGPSGAGPGSGDSVSANVDYSDFLTESILGCPTLPPADLAIVKTVTPAIATPGQAITYTLSYGNAGAGLAAAVLITDVVPPEQVVNLSYTSSGATITPIGGVSYTWQVQALAPGAGGVITISGELATPLTEDAFTNIAIITTTAVDSDPANNSSSAGVTVRQPTFFIYLPLVLKNNA
jgi:uncharacterized repeat protein (TIGR01451 family)